MRRLRGTKFCRRQAPRAALDRGGPGAWQSCITDCRNALDLWFAQEKPDLADGIKKDDWTKKQRFDRLRQALRDCIHAGVHNDASQNTRSDAVLALSTLVALIAVRSQ